MFLRPGGGFVHSEGILLQDGRMYPARTIHQPGIGRFEWETGDVGYGLVEQSG